MSKFRSRSFGDYTDAIIRLIVLIQTLKTWKSKKGCYITIIILVATAIEGIILMFNDDKGVKGEEKFNIYRQKIKENDFVEEIFIIRDTLAHQHCYDYEVNRNEPNKRENIKKREGFGDKKFNISSDNTTLKTNNLKINFMPDNIEESDVKIVIKFYYNLLNHLSKNSIYKNLFDNILNDYDREQYNGTEKSPKIGEILINYIGNDLSIN